MIPSSKDEAQKRLERALNESRRTVPVEIEFDGKKALEVSMDGDWGIIQFNNRDGLGLCSYGFAGCCALIVETGNYIALLHDSNISSAKNANEVHDYIDKKIASLCEKIVYKKDDLLTVSIGYSREQILSDFKQELQGRAGRESINEAKLIDEEKERIESVVKILKESLGSDFFDNPRGFIDLPKGTIFIEANGKIRTDIEMDVMREARKNAIQETAGLSRIVNSASIIAPIETMQSPGGSPNSPIVERAAKRLKTEEK